MWRLLKLESVKPEDVFDLGMEGLGSFVDRAYRVHRREEFEDATASERSEVYDVLLEGLYAFKAGVLAYLEGMIVPRDRKHALRMYVSNIKEESTKVEDTITDLKSWSDF